MSLYKRGHYDSYDPRSALPEFEGIFERPMYAPTPLNPYALEKDGEPYVTHAQAVIMDLFTRNLDELRVRPPDAVINLLLMSVNSALVQRFEENGNKFIPPDCDEVTAELFVKACLGRASADELIDLLARHPGSIQSIELAKQTHPFKWGVTSAMDIEIDTMMTRNDFTRHTNVYTQDVGHYVMTADDIRQPSAAITVRKADVGMKQISSSERIVVVQRDSFVVDLTHDDTAGVAPEFKKWMTKINGPKRFSGHKEVYEKDGMAEFIDEQLMTPHELRSPALYPGVRSYYAHYAAALETTHHTE